MSDCLQPPPPPSSLLSCDGVRLPRQRHEGATQLRSANTAVDTTAASESSGSRKLPAQASGAPRAARRTDGLHQFLHSTHHRALQRQ